jgi:pyruvate formate lyase activating enzyme
MPPDANTALILHLQRLSTEDGPGIRTTVFFKGCSLRCSWCHNPESIVPSPQVQWIKTHCIGCESCLTACPNGALSRLPDGAIQIDRDLCQSCGTCADVCPANAMELLGRTVTLDELTHELLKDKAYYGTSGGVTASGGEPSLQPAFVTKLFQRLQAEGIHTALDTCGACSQSCLSQILPYTNLVLFDLKLMDSTRHRQETGQENRRILANLMGVAEQIKDRGCQTELWIRTPLIPGITTTKENLHSISAFLQDKLDGMVTRWELCAFNNLCRDKYRRLGLSWQFDETPLMTQAELDICEANSKSGSFDASRIFISGAVKTEP